MAQFPFSLMSLSVPQTGFSAHSSGYTAPWDRFSTFLFSVHKKNMKALFILSLMLIIPDNKIWDNKYSKLNQITKVKKSFLGFYAYQES